MFFFFNDTATTEIYTLSLHDALPISSPRHTWPSSPWAAITSRPRPCGPRRSRSATRRTSSPSRGSTRSEEHTSELQSRLHLVCRLLLEKKKKETYETEPNAPTRHTTS